MDKVQIWQGVAMGMHILRTAEVMEAAEENLSQAKRWVDAAMPTIIDFGWDLLELALIYFIGTRLIKLAIRFMKRALSRSKLDKAVQMMSVQVIRVLLYMVLISVMMKAVGYETTSLVALIGSAGLSIGLAFQGSLSNFAGGVLLMITKPFQIGDYITEDTHGNSGTVVRLGLTYTTLLTPDEKTVTVPNGALANSSLTNFSTQGKRRVEVSVSISYKEDLKKAKAVMEKALEDVSRRLPNQPVTVFVDQLAESAVVLGGWVWVLSSDYLSSKWEANEKIKLSFDEQNIHIPLPQMDVHVLEKQGVQKAEEERKTK